MCAKRDIYGPSIFVCGPAEEPEIRCIEAPVGEEEGAEPVTSEELARRYCAVLEESFPDTLDEYRKWGVRFPRGALLHSMVLDVASRGLPEADRLQLRYRHCSFSDPSKVTGIRDPGILLCAGWDISLISAMQKLAIYVGSVAAGEEETPRYRVIFLVDPYLSELQYLALIPQEVDVEEVVPALFRDYLRSLGKFFFSPAYLSIVPNRELTNYVSEVVTAEQILSWYREGLDQVIVGGYGWESLVYLCLKRQPDRDETPLIHRELGEDINEDILLCHNVERLCEVLKSASNEHAEAIKSELMGWYRAHIYTDFVVGPQTRIYLGRLAAALLLNALLSNGFSPLEITGLVALLHRVAKESDHHTGGEED